MKDRTLLAIKFVMTTFLMYITTGVLFHWTFSNIVMISLFTTCITFILSDLVILPVGGNAIATSADFVLTLIGSWSIGTIVTGGGTIPLLQGPLCLALVIAVIEWLFFHRLLEKQQPNERRNESTA
ncbi:MAG TPA: DUF2512 family protein [Bacillales bacterium]